LFCLAPGRKRSWGSDYHRSSRGKY